MRKILLLHLFCAVLILSFFVATNRPLYVDAAPPCGNWSIITNPSPVVAGTKNINLSIQTVGLVTGDIYTVVLKNVRINPVTITDPTLPSLPRDVEVAHVPLVSDGKININNLNVYGEINNTNPIDSFWSGSYSLEVRDGGGNVQCGVGFSVQQAPSQPRCTVSLTNKSFSPNNDITVNVSPVSDGKYRVKLERIEGGRKSTNCYDASSGNLTANLGKAEVGVWRVIVMNSCTVEALEINQCVSQNFRITLDGSQGGPTGGLGPVTPQDFVTTCPDGTQGISTAIGCIPIGDANSFAGWFLKWAIGIAGGIAFLMLIFSGFQIMTSSNNPQQLQTGRELLTAAVSGLILIVFSAFLLKLIGVDILGIPWLGSP